MLGRESARQRGDLRLMGEQGLETIESTTVVASYIGAGEMTKVMHSFPNEWQSLFPALASAA